MTVFPQQAVAISAKHSKKDLESLTKPLITNCPLQVKISSVWKAFFSSNVLFWGGGGEKKAQGKGKSSAVGYNSGHVNRGDSSIRCLTHQKSYQSFVQEIPRE